MISRKDLYGFVTWQRYLVRSDWFLIKRSGFPVMPTVILIMFLCRLFYPGRGNEHCCSYFQYTSLVHVCVYPRSVCFCCVLYFCLDVLIILYFFNSYFRTSSTLPLPCKIKSSFHNCFSFPSVIFHISTLMPNRDSDPGCNSKKLHIGNDFVTVVYNDSDEDVKFGVIRVIIIIIIIITITTIIIMTLLTNFLK